MRIASLLTMAGLGLSTQAFAAPTLSGSGRRWRDGWRCVESAMSVWILFHIVCGVAALLSMFVPVFTKKGGRSHRLGGRVYVWSMAGVVASALTVCAIRLLDETADHEGAYFLALVGILAGANTWYGVRVLQQKTRQQARQPRGSKHCPDCCHRRSCRYRVWLRGIAAAVHRIRSAVSRWVSDSCARWQAPGRTTRHGWCLT